MPSMLVLGRTLPLGRLLAASALLLTVLAAGGALWLGRPAAQDRYTVVDGDTLEWVPRHCAFSSLGLGCPAQRLRLYGVDAFEGGQRCEDAAGVPWPCGAVAT